MELPSKGDVKRTWLTERGVLVARRRRARATGELALEKNGKLEADRQWKRQKRKNVAAAEGDPVALATHRKDPKQKALQRTSRNIDSLHIADIFQRYRQGEDLTATDRADYEASDEPREWKMVASSSQYMDGLTLAKSNYFFDRFPPAVASVTVVCSQQSHVHDGLSVAEAPASFDYKYHLRLHQKTSTVDTPTPFLPLPLAHNISKKNTGTRAHISPRSV